MTYPPPQSTARNQTSAPAGPETRTMAKATPQHQQQELFIVVAARLAAGQVRRTRLQGGDRSRPTMPTRGRRSCCCRRRSWCRASRTTASRSGTRWRSPSTCNEVKPKSGLLPTERAARAHCRAVCGEMHSGFSSLRSALPMNLKRHFPKHKVWARAIGDIERITTIWRECLATYGGPVPVRQAHDGRRDVRAGGHALRHLRRRRRQALYGLRRR